MSPHAGRAYRAIPTELAIYLERKFWKVPELQQLTIVGRDPKSSWEAWGDNAPLIQAFRVAPKLRRVSAENIRLYINYPQLTSFTEKFSVYFPLPIPPVTVIECCVDLVHMEANLIGALGDPDFDAESVSRSFSNLSLTQFTANDPVLLAYLLLPALSPLTSET